MLNFSRKLLISLIVMNFGICNSMFEAVSAQSVPITPSTIQHEKLTWDTIAQIATALGVGISTASIFASYRLYQMSKRDEYVNNLRTSILLNQERSERLESLVNYELANEMVNCVVYSKDLELPLLNILNNFFKSDTATEDELRVYFKENFPSITTSIHSATVSLFDDLTVLISSDLVKYQLDAPGYYRVTSSLRNLYNYIEANLKILIRSEEKWIDYLIYLFKVRKDEISTVRSLKHKLSNIFIAEIHNGYLMRSRKDIDDLLHISRIVSHAYLSLSESDLFKFSRTEKSQNLSAVSSTIPDSLKEAEKSLKHILDSDSLHKYWELMARFEERNTPQSN